MKRANYRVAAIAAFATAAGLIMSGCAPALVLQGVAGTAGIMAIGDSTEEMRTQALKTCEYTSDQKACIEKAEEGFYICDERGGRVERRRCYRRTHNDIRQLMIDNCNELDTSEKDECLKKAPAIIPINQ